ncbi:hypothetical protein BDW59DRAFT_150757 [Aspergillus cavernicola]|uniref:Uncharacterized protein n=1 Tax=Aspergillus cavernicola TaxID=176166 RepID=A0ABR4HYF6_9EURO
MIAMACLLGCPVVAAIVVGTSHVVAHLWCGVGGVVVSFGVTETHGDFMCLVR